MPNRYLSARAIGARREERIRNIDTEAVGRVLSVGMNRLRSIGAVTVAQEGSVLHKLQQLSSSPAPSLQAIVDEKFLLTNFVVRAKNKALHDKELSFAAREKILSEAKNAETALVALVSILKSLDELGVVLPKPIYDLPIVSNQRAAFEEKGVSESRFVNGRSQRKEVYFEEVNKLFDAEWQRRVELNRKRTPFERENLVLSFAAEADKRPHGLNLSKEESEAIHNFMENVRNGRGNISESVLELVERAHIKARIIERLLSSR